ncbi:MAG TPA: glycosyltransferase family A protein [Thermoanaerobaculia bacterium]|nr:glycosyltransferase family A protein [Thermoanaerobaculia bacterium]
MLAAAALAGVALLAFASRLAATRAAAPPLPDPDPARPAPSTLAVLPVRDEEANVAACAASLLAQSAPLRVRVVDDDSRDATAARVAELAAGAGGRLELLAAGPLSKGWVGKVHALARGCAGADTEWLLFTDADTRHHPELLARAHAAAAAEGLDLVSVAGWQRAAGMGAGLLTPAVFALLDADLGDWEPHARGEGTPPVANGQFLLLRRTALDDAGGLAALAGAPEIDDVALARRVSAAGGRVGFFRALDLLEVEMYRGFRAAWQGWRRNLALLYGQRPHALLGAAAAAALPGFLLAFLLAAGEPGAALLLWAMAAIASAAIRLPARFPLAPALLAPLEGILFASLLLTALADHRRGRLAPWRGRVLPSAGTGEGESDQPGSGAA